MGGIQKTIINEKDYRKKVLGCWMGKNIGGTLGAPLEFFRQKNDVSFYLQKLDGNPMPNDDLDLQLIWLIALEFTVEMTLNGKSIVMHVPIVLLNGNK